LYLHSVLSIGFDNTRVYQPIIENFVTWSESDSAHLEAHCERYTAWCRGWLKLAHNQWICNRCSSSWGQRDRMAWSVSWTRNVLSFLWLHFAPGFASRRAMVVLVLCMYTQPRLAQGAPYPECMLLNKWSYGWDNWNAHINTHRYNQCSPRWELLDSWPLINGQQAIT